MAGSFETFGLPKSVHQQPIDPLAPLGSSQAPPAPSHSNMNVMYHSQHGPTFASFVDTSFLTDVSLETSQKISTIQQKLDKKLGPEFVSQRPGPAGGPKLTYAEGWKIIGLANEVFGFNGWSSHVVSLTTDYIDYNEETRRYNVGVTALVKVTLRDGTFHEDVGYGMLDNSRSKGAALDKCKKEAVTDAVKRALRNFGNLLGNCLYDKSYTQEVVKMSTPKAKFDKEGLHRRTQHDQVGSHTNSPSNLAGPSVVTTDKQNASSTSNANALVKPELTSPKKYVARSSAPPPILGAIPSHIRAPSGFTASTPVAKGKAGPSGLNPGAQVTPASDLNHGGQGYRQRQVQGPRTGLSTPAETPVRPAGAGAGESEVERNAQPQVSPDIAEGSSVKPHVAKELPQLQQQPQINAIRTRQAEAQPNSAPLVDPISLHPPPQHRKKAKSPTPLARDDESYGMFSDDDAFYATVDLGDGSGVGLGVGEGGDEGVGGFIDFDEGVGGYESDGEYEVGVREGQQIQAQEQAPPQQNQQPHLAVPTSNSGAGGAVRKQGSSDSVSEWSEQGPTSSMGGFHFPGTAVGSKPAAVSTALGSRPQQGAVQQPQRNAASTGSAGGVMNMLKRSADVMQGQQTGAGPARRPMQGMGLSNNPSGAGFGRGGGVRREPLAPLEVGDGGDVKRARR